ncbi:LolA family protein [Asticcacaulis tiandongensis]|uniref:LolA family protein n=1 Tax=Asticcacaulis tiandongensis TaxID=2565365 RepID=UPI001125C9EA|nr:outer-membrane lipoprotein carrier protein LolA [Asticcacaulis tiandongensis]
MTDLTKRTLLLSLAASAVAAPALARRSPTQPFISQPKFKAEDQARITRAQSYLQSLTTGSGRFQQTDFKGRVTQGDWWLSRPGKIRFEYDAPYSMIVVADGKRVNMWDPRLKSFDQYPLELTPLSLFLSKNIRFDQGVIITEVTSTSDGFRLKARDRRKEVEGSITLNFIEKTKGGALTLGEWTVTDAQNKATRVKLLSFKTNVNPKADLFILNKPKGVK